MVTGELAPYARQTKAADAVAALAKALRQLGHDVTIALPRYPGFEAGGLLLARRLTPLTLPGGAEVAVFDGQLSSGVHLALFDAPVLFDRPGVYGEDDSEDYPDNAKRFGLLSQAAAALVRLRAQQGKTFDLVHLHDWAAALVPAALRVAPGPILASVLTIHDMTRQGVFPVEDSDALGASDELVSEFRLDGAVNFLKGGIALADAITTVSPSYAEAVQKEERGGALAEVLRGCQKPIHGLCHGIDYALYNPATDTSLASRYDAEDTSNKGRSKSALIKKLELELEPGRPLVFAIVERGAIAGTALLAAALPDVLANDLSLVIAGPHRLLEAFRPALDTHPERLALVESPDDATVHRLYAASDFVLQSFEHDPSGTSSMIAHRYGALPVALAADAIKDVVVDCDAALETGTGFVFDNRSESELVGALQRALAAYRSAAFPRLIRRVMRLDVGWDRPARRYLQIYRQTLAMQA